MKEWHQNLLNSPSHWILTRIPVGCHYYYRTVEGTEAQRSCHKARMVESGFEPGSDSFQSSCIVFPLHSAFPNEAAHQTHWKRPIKKYIFPDPTSDLFAQIFAVGPRNLYFKPWFLYRCLINVSLLNESSLKTGAMSVLFSDKRTTQIFAVWLNAQASQPWPIGQLWRAFKLFVANPPEHFSNFNVHFKNYLGCLLFFLIHIMRPQPQRFYAWGTGIENYVKFW